MSELRNVYPPGSRRFPRRYSVVDIKLLRLGLIGDDAAIVQGLSTSWEPAQPTENLSPQLAAEHLKTQAWERESVIRLRYRKLQSRFPPEQFADKHLHWRPAAELLGSPLRRLNWYWESGLIPDLEVFEAFQDEWRRKGEEMVYGRLACFGALGAGSR